MSDPLSLAASGASLLSLGLQSTEYLYRFYTAYRDRDHDLARIADQLGNLLSSLRIINDTIRTRRWRTDEQTVLRHIETSLVRCDDVIHVMQDEAHKFEKEPAPDLKTAVVGAGRRVTYPFRRSTLEKLNEEVDDFRNNLSLAVQVLHLKEHHNAQTDLEELKHIVKSAQVQHVATSLCQWLKAPDTSVDYNNACNKRHAATGDWFVQSAAFDNWLKQENSLLWLYGFAGCGKSVLCSTAIQHTFRHQRARVGAAVAFFFFTFDDDSKQDCSAALRALLFQLCGQVAGLEAELTRLQSTYNQSTPPIPVLTECLRQTVTRCRHTYILLDALDETPPETAREDVLSMVETMRQWQLSGLHLLVTSRDTSDIRSCLGAQADVPNTDSVPLKNESIDQDIRNYVSHKVDHERDLRRWSVTDRQKIKDYLSEHADGVFRWITLQLNALKKCPRSPRLLESCLETLPRTLGETYERMLSNISKELKDYARRVLSLLSYSARPLFVDEVIEAIAVDTNDSERYDQDRRLADADDLLRICPGLIEISLHEATSVTRYLPVIRRFLQNTGEEDEQHIQLVRIGHFSVQEYLISDDIRQSPVSAFALQGPREHAEIAKTCILYLSNNDFVMKPLSPPLIRHYSLAPYAAEHWHYHFSCWRNDGEPIPHLFEQFISFVTARETFSRWIELYDADDAWDNKLDYKKRKVYGSCIYYMALLGFHDLLARILYIPSADVNAQGGTCNTALQAASQEGHEKVVQMLLDHGADVDADGVVYSTALQRASREGHEKVVQMLLKHGANVNASRRPHATALQAASWEGHEKVVQMLLHHGADVNAEGGEYGTALQAASLRGHEKLVQMLVNAGADEEIQ